MRFLTCVSMFLCLVTYCRGQETRQKRFLNTDGLSFLPQSFAQLGYMARDLSDQISSQASMAVQQMMPQSSRRRAALNREMEVPTYPKRNGRPPHGRETEGEEVEIFEPEPQRPPKPVDNSPDDAWFRPLVPFSFSFGLLTPWWEGPNVCVETDEVEEPEEETEDLNFGGFTINFETTRCVPSDSAHVCTRKIQSNGVRKTIVTRRQCCHGYIRRTDGRPGCSALKMENVLDTLKVLEMRSFIQWLESAGLKDNLIRGNYTVFAPTNEAINDYEDETEDNEISAIDPVKRMTDISSIVQSHIIEGFVNVDHLEDEQLLDTFNPDVKIRINKFHPGQKIVTANCIPISGKNNFASNGIVHLVSGVLPQPSQMLGDIIEQDNRFSIFRKLLVESGMMEELKKSGQAWTLFAPTDEAFAKLPRSLRNQIESGEACVENILHQHLVKGTVCSSAVINQIKVKNNLENVLHITKDESEKLRVDGATMDSENILGTNGVIHAMDKVLIPPQAQSIIKSLEEQERQDMLDLLETADLLSTLEDMKNITFFVPSKEAMQNLPNETLQEMKNNTELVRKIMFSHLVASHNPTSAFSDNKQLETLNGHSIHMKLHELFPGIITGATVQCAYITSHDHHACGAVMHKINKVLMPPKGSIVETLKQMEGHKIVAKLLEGTDLEKKLDEDGPFTFLAPTDAAFEKIQDPSLDEMMEDKKTAEDILKLHVLPETLCCNSISHITPFHRQFVRTLDGSILPLQRNLYDRVRFGRARALQCDMIANNGLIHSISRVLQPQRHSVLTLFGI